MPVPVQEESTSLIDTLKTKLERRLSDLKTKYSKKRNVQKLCQTVIAVAVVLVMVCYEISSQRLERNLFNPEDAICEDLSEINETMFNIAREALNSISRQGLSEELKKDPDGSWMLTTDVNIGQLTAQDVNHFNKYINCSGKFRWLHPENNELSYWIEGKSAREAQKGKSRQKQQTDQTRSNTGEDQEKHRHKRGKHHFHKSRRQGLSHGDIKRYVTTANSTSLRWEVIFNDNICLKGGNPHVCVYEEGAEIVYRARIQKTVVWLGNFKLGQISAAVIKDKETGDNILRTKLAIGGEEARFTGSSIMNKIVNAVAVPTARNAFYDEEYAMNVHRHMMEESYISGKIMQYLHED